MDIFVKLQCYIYLEPEVNRVTRDAGALLDASSNIPENEWYHATEDWGYLSSWCQSWTGPQCLTCVDIFGASQKFQKLFVRKGYQAVAFDLKLSAAFDITCESGFMQLLEWGMQSFGISFQLFYFYLFLMKFDDFFDRLDFASPCLCCLMSEDSGWCLSPNRSTV